jgi:hypothetical protein
MAAPVMILLSVFLYKFRNCLKSGTRSAVLYQIIFAAYFVFITIIPISYGFHIYDWKIIPVEKTATFNSLNEQDKIWLLGEFRGRYVFLKKSGIETSGIIETVSVDDVDRLNFDVKRAESLKYHMTMQSQSRIKSEANKVLDEMFINTVASE